MNGQHDIDPTRAALITERIDQGFDFVRDVIDNPQILETIPHKSMLMFRYIPHFGRTMRLTAYLPKHPGARWGARVTGMTPAAVAAVPSASESQPPPDDSGRWPAVDGYDTAEAALDALEAEIGAVAQPGPVVRRALGA